MFNRHSVAGALLGVATGAILSFLIADFYQSKLGSWYKANLLRINPEIKDLVLAHPYFSEDERIKNDLAWARDLAVPDLRMFPEDARLAADLNFSARPIDGRERRMDFLKGKVVFLNVWATWCGPCRMEMPGIQRLYEKLAGDGRIVFVAISDESPETVRKFFKKRKYTFPSYTIKGDLPPVLACLGIPTTFIIDPDGRIVVRHVGGCKWDDKTVIDFLGQVASQGGKRR